MVRIKVSPATPEEVADLRNRSRKWDFPDELFDGEWHKVEVPNDVVTSVSNALRKEANVTRKRRANIYLKDGAIFYRLTKDPIKPKTNGA